MGVRGGKGDVLMDLQKSKRKYSEAKLGREKRSLAQRKETQGFSSVAHLNSRKTLGA